MINLLEINIYCFTLPFCITTTYIPLFAVTGRMLKEKQSLLVRKHEETRRKVDSLNIGGGVSMWPEMDSMRMSTDEIYRLSGFCAILVLLVVAIFTFLHGKVVVNEMSSERSG